MKGFLRTFIQPDHDEDPRRAEVLQAANLLQVGEFQFLQLAHADWFGTDMPETMTGQVFKSYMLGRTVPSWARHYARKVLAQAAAGEIDVNDPAFHRFDPDYRTRIPNGWERFVRASGILVLLLVAGFAAAHMAVRDHPATSILPPYFNDQQMGGDRQQGGGPETPAGRPEG